MAIKKRGTSKDLWKKKTWYDITAPKLFDEMVVGETPALDKKMVLGRTLDVLANEVGSGPRNTKLRFKVSAIEGNKAKTDLIGIELVRGYLKSLTKRRTTKVSSVTDLETKDKVKVRVKTMAFTLKTCTENQRASVRKKVDELVKIAVNGATYESLVTELLSGSVQKTIKDETKQVYPLKLVVFKSVSLL